MEDERSIQCEGTFLFTKTKSLLMVPRIAEESVDALVNVQKTLTF